jgi:hypothetical protein
MHISLFNCDNENFSSGIPLTLMVSVTKSFQERFNVALAKPHTSLAESNDGKPIFAEPVIDCAAGYVQQFCEFLHCQESVQRSPPKWLFHSLDARRTRAQQGAHR